MQRAAHGNVCAAAVRPVLAAAFTISELGSAVFVACTGLVVFHGSGGIYCQGTSKPVGSVQHQYWYQAQWQKTVCWVHLIKPSPPPVLLEMPLSCIRVLLRHTRAHQICPECVGLMLLFVMFGQVCLLTSYGCPTTSAIGLVLCCDHTQSPARSVGLLSAIAAGCMLH